jgi:hypothetical protein
MAHELRQRQRRLFELHKVHTWYKQKLGNNLNSVIEAAEENVRLLKGLKEIAAHEKLIADLNDQVICVKDQMNINKAAIERIRWEIDIQEKDLVAAMGQVVVQKDIESRGGVDGSTNDASLKKEFQRGSNVTIANLSHIVLAGAYVRGKKLEWFKGDSQEADLVDLAVKAAHYGMAMADASLCRPGMKHFDTKAREDTDIYVALYDVTHQYAWRRRTVKKFNEFLGWRGGMKDFYPKDEHYKSTMFRTVWSAMLADVKAIFVKDGPEKLQESFEENDDKCRMLESEYEKARKSAKVRHQSR